jgi:hypothetical protein
MVTEWSSIYFTFGIFHEVEAVGFDGAIFEFDPSGCSSFKGKVLIRVTW